MSQMPFLRRRGRVFFREHAPLIVAARKGRNTALYDTAGTVSPSFVAEVTRVVSELLEQVRHR